MSLSSTLCRFAHNVRCFVYEGRREGLRELSHDAYMQRVGRGKIAKAAFEKAWQTRNFEIELYWKRATYFWAFTASAFAGYFGLVSADHYTKPDNYSHVEVYVSVLKS